MMTRAKYRFITPISPLSLIQVWVVALWPQQQLYQSFIIKIHTTAQQLLAQSAYLQKLNLDQVPPLGIYGKQIKTPQSYFLKQYDRLELYRPLLIDPKHRRKLRAVKHPVGRMTRFTKSSLRSVKSN